MPEGARPHGAVVQPIGPPAAPMRPTTVAAPPLLAVVVMAFNEQDVLERCLESVKGLGELFVSIDDATTDGSEAVARRYTANISSHVGLPAEQIEDDHAEAPKARNSYSRMRNDVLDHVEARTKAPWLMWLDPDEFLIEGGDVLLRALAELLPQTEIGAVAIKLRLYRRDDGAFTGLLRNSKILRRGLRFTRRRHEHIQIKGKQFILDDCVLGHHPCQEATVRFAHDVRKVQLKPFMDDWLEFRDGRSAFYVADWWRLNGETETAMAWYDMGIALPVEKCPPLQRAQIAVYAGRLAMHCDQPERARKYLFRALQDEWNYAEALFYLGKLAADKGDLNQARHWFRFCLQYAAEPGGVMEQATGMTREWPVYGLASVAHKLGHRKEAYALLADATRLAVCPRPEFAELYRRLDAERGPKREVEELAA